MNWTAFQLMQRGHDPRPLRAVFDVAFTKAETTPVRNVQAFWDEFVKAHAVIFPRGDRLAEAA
jgi:hypothetical protein